MDCLSSPFTIGEAEVASRVEENNVCEERYEIAYPQSGDTLCLNGDDGHCWARFNKRFGADVHHARSMPDSSAECLFCTHGCADINDRKTFTTAVARHQEVHSCRCLNFCRKPESRHAINCLIYDVRDAQTSFHFLDDRLMARKIAFRPCLILAHMNLSIQGSCNAIVPPQP